MKIVYASRTGNVESIVNRLGLIDTFQIDKDQGDINEEYVLITYTDGYGDIPVEVDDFLSSNSDYLRGVIVSGDTGYGEAYCLAGDKIAQEYNVPCLYKVENDGDDQSLEDIKKIIASL